MFVALIRFAALGDPVRRVLEPMVVELRGRGRTAL
jgi:hypothetical protein